MSIFSRSEVVFEDLNRKSKKIIPDDLFRSLVSCITCLMVRRSEWDGTAVSTVAVGTDVLFEGRS